MWHTCERGRGLLPHEPEASRSRRIRARGSAHLKVGDQVMLIIVSCTV